MRETRLSGSEGGARQTNASLLPLSGGLVAVAPPLPQRETAPAGIP